MTSRRFALQPSKTPTLTGGDDRPACDGDWLPFWALIENPRSLYAREACLTICNACPIRETCWDTHAAAGEEWAQSLNGTLPLERGCDVEGCNKPHNAHGLCPMHYKRARKEQGAA